MSKNTLTEINGSPLNSEQTSYLDGFFTGMKERGLTFGDVEAAPALTAPTPKAGKLIKEERIKQELHPLDAYPLLQADATTNQPPESENVFRYKWNGLFYLTPVNDAFMARLRIPGGVLKTFQVREIARIAKELTTGIVQVTTRANLQIRLIKLKDTLEVLRRIQGVGLHTRGAGADNIRNITANPTAGIDPYETIDVLPYCEQLAQTILQQREFYDLPRKFNIAFDGGGLIGSVEDTNDIGLKAIRWYGTGEGPAAGIYFRIKLGGATGHQAFANDLNVLVPPDQLLQVVVALLRVYIQHGNRGNRKRARLKHLLEDWTLDQYRQETEKLLGYKMIDAPDTASDGYAETPTIAHSHVGVFPQSQKGLNYIGVSVPVGQITPRQLMRLADLADHYGSSEMRLTVWQNLILPNIPDGFVETVKRALVKMGLGWEQSNLRSGLIACTGNSYCKFASANTKGHARELADYLDKRLTLDQPVNIHVTGCPHSCAQHYMGDIGLLATKVKVSGESVEGYHVFVGGGFGKNQALGRQVYKGLSFSEIKPTLEKILLAYLAARKEEETFQQFTSRHDLNSLQNLFEELPAEPVSA